MVLVRILHIILMLFLEETENMNRLIVEMLELAKLESGTYKLDMTTFSIGELTHKSTQNYYLAWKKNIYK